jgi:hypothetical protein
VAQHQSDAGDEFDAAKIIVETLKKLERPQQERAIRFASEALGLKSSQQAEPRATATSMGAIPPPPPPPPPAGHATDIKQFTALKSPKSDQQFAAVAAYFYQFEAQPSERRETINAEVLANAARLVNRRRPTRHVLNNAKNSGYLDSVSAGEFKINTVGENLVAMTLPGNAGEGSRKAKKARKKSKSKTVRNKKK